jgi:hypothetical protein
VGQGSANSREPFAIAYTPITSEHSLTMIRIRDGANTARMSEGRVERSEVVRQRKSAKLFTGVWSGFNQRVLRIANLGIGEL